MARDIPVLRIVTLVLVVLALADVRVPWGSAPVSIAVLLDRSASTAGGHADAPAQLREASAAMHSADRAALIVFGGDAAVEQPLASSLPSGELTSTVASGSTNIAEALRLARATLPADGARRMVLWSDGWESAGDALSEARRAAAAGISIDVVIPDGLSSASSSMEVTRVTAPAVAAVDEPFAIAVTVAGPADGGVDVVLHRPSGSTATQRLRVSADGVAVARFIERAETTGSLTFRVELRTLGALDVQAADAEAGATVFISGPPRVLYVGRPALSIATALGRAGFMVEPLAVSDIPRSAEALASYDSVILDDVPGDALDARQKAAIANHVEEQGAGLFVLGGPRSLDPAVAVDEAIGRVLPIDLRPRSGRRAPSLATVIVFDKSGSMDDRVGGVPRIEFARRAVHGVLEWLPATDAVGVIAFDAMPVAVSALAANPDKRLLRDRLQELEPAGPTRIAPALAMAAAWLRNAGAHYARRQLVLISDGRTTPDDAERARQVARDANVPVSVVAPGGRLDAELLEWLAKQTGGDMTVAADATLLPALVARAVSRATGGRFVDSAFTPQLRTHAINAGLPANFPQLGGYVVSTAKPDAEIVLASHLGDPILATRRAGLGKVAAYTADVNGPWSARLHAWDGFVPLLTQTVRWVSRRGTNELLFAEMVDQGITPTLVVEAGQRDGTPVPLQRPIARVRGPSGEDFIVRLDAVAPGRYEAAMPVTEAGSYLVRIASAGHPATQEILRGFFWAATHEHSRRGVNRAGLEALAGATGGRVLAQFDELFAVERQRQHQSIRGWLIAAALVMFLIELARPMRRGRFPDATSEASDRGRVRAA